MSCDTSRSSTWQEITSAKGCGRAEPVLVTADCAATAMTRPRPDDIAKRPRIVHIRCVVTVAPMPAPLPVVGPSRALHDHGPPATPPTLVRATVPSPHGTLPSEATVASPSPLGSAVGSPRGQGCPSRRNARRNGAPVTARGGGYAGGREGTTVRRTAGATLGTLGRGACPRSPCQFSKRPPARGAAAPAERADLGGAPRRKPGAARTAPGRWGGVRGTVWGAACGVRTGMRHAGTGPDHTPPQYARVNAGGNWLLVANPFPTIAARM